jgi:hypothetical protein
MVGQWQDSHRINVADNNKMYSDLQAKFPTFYPISPNVELLDSFRWSPQYKISRNSLQWELRWYMRRDGQTETQAEGHT